MSRLLPLFVIASVVSATFSAKSTIPTPIERHKPSIDGGGRTTEFQQASCSFVKGLHANLLRFITQEGFHRDLEDTLEITVTTSPIPTTSFKTGECLLGILHEFSRDIYVDPYEILRYPAVSEYVRVLNNWTDLENSAWSATSNSTVFIQFRPILTGNLISTESIPLPIHYRYQKPKSGSHIKSTKGLQNPKGFGGLAGFPSRMLKAGGYVPVTLPLPEIILRCDNWDSAQVEEQCRTVSLLCHRKSIPGSNCLWVKVPYKSNRKSGTILIPVGDSDSTFLITSVSIVVVLGGMLFLMFTLVQRKKQFEYENSGTCSECHPPPSSSHSHTD